MFSQSRAGRSDGGQALVEFSLAFIVFVVLMMGVFDFGRGIYVMNGVSQAAREIARTTSVHPGSTLGDALQAKATISTQRGLVPGMRQPTFECVQIDGSPSSAPSCGSGDFVRVTVIADYTPVTLLGLTGTFAMSSSSSIRIP
jgi:hypothetical protein